MVFTCFSHGLAASCPAIGHEMWGGGVSNPTGGDAVGFCFAWGVVAPSEGAQGTTAVSQEEAAWVRRMVKLFLGHGAHPVYGAHGV